jgi:hypothetical protein
LSILAFACLAHSCDLARARTTRTSLGVRKTLGRGPSGTFTSMDLTGSPYTPTASPDINTTKQHRLVIDNDPAEIKSPRTQQIHQANT